MVATLLCLFSMPIHEGVQYTLFVHLDTSVCLLMHLATFLFGI